MIKWLPFILCIFHVATTLAQPVSGTITNADGKPVSGVHVFCLGKNVGEVSDKNGHYNINTDGCDYVVFRHLHFKQKVISSEILKKTPDIILEDTVFFINAVDIYSKPVIALLPDTPIFVYDYEICKDRIIMCAFFQRKLNQPILLYSDLNGNIIDSKTLSETGNLYQDPEGTIYLTQKNYAYQLIIENNKIMFSDAFEAKHVTSAKQHWTHSVGDSIILRYYYFKNQGVGYFIKHLSNDSIKLFLEFVDEDAYDRMKWGSYFDGCEFDKRFEELIVYKPIQIPIFFRKNDIVAFNFVTWKIQYFGFDGNFISEIDMQFGDQKKIKHEIYFDNVLNKYYGREIRNGLNSLIELDVSTGKMVKYFSFKGYPHIEKLNVSDGVLYFIYKDYSGDEYKRLYKSPLINMVAGR
jgi:hypothetical protein